MVTHEGYLWKWTNYLGGWQQRWFILYDGTLTYYKDANTTDTGCRGSFKLEACNISVHPVDPLRFDLTTTSQRIYLKTNTKPNRQKWIIHLGTTKACISEEMPDVRYLASYKDHKSELKTCKLLLTEQLEQLKEIIETDPIDKALLTQTQAMISGLCDEFSRTLSHCTSNICDERECSTPLLNRNLSEVFDSQMSLGTPAVTNSVRNSVSSINERSPESINRLSNISDDSGDSDVSSHSVNVSNDLHVLGSKRAERLPSTYFTSVADRFEDLQLTANHIPTVAFLDACATLPNLLQAIGGKSLLTMSLDITNNLNKLKTKQKLNPSKTTSLQAMIHLEIATQTTHAKHCATDALLWLKRELAFIKEFIFAIIRGSSDMSAAFLDCYEKTLKPHHSFTSKSIYTIAAKTIPYREDMLRALGHDGMSATEYVVLMDLETYATAMNTLVLYIETFYINNKLLS